MFISYRITACVIALVTGAVIFRLVRRSLLHGSDAAWWLGASLVAVLVGLFPGSFDILGHALGVSYPPILFLVLTLVVFAVRMLVSDVERARMELTQRRLIQHAAHMALRLRDIERELGARGISLSTVAPVPAEDGPDLAETPLPPSPPLD